MNIMKKTIVYFLFLIAGIFTACDPIEDRDTMTGTLTADELDVSATPIVVDGMNTNKIILENHSSVLSWWNYGLGSSQNATDTVNLVVVGTATITFTGLNGDGSEVTKELTVDVDTLYYEVDPQWGYLCGEGEKTWTWDTSVNSCFGNGGYLGNSSPGWWALSVAEIDEQAAGEGEGATMVFSTNGATLTKYLTDDTSESGTFDFDMTETTYDDSGSLWATGILNTTGVTVLCGISINESGIDVNEYDILELNDETLTLSYHADGTGSWGEAWFWMFAPAE
jgi:hypothetical protein